MLINLYVYIMNNLIIAILFISSIIISSNKFTKSNVNSPWYQCIKPNITPPNYIFPVVWSILYIFLTIILKNILDSKNNLLIFLFIINVLLHIQWTYLYFNKKDIKNAFITILLILLSSVVILNMLDKNKLLYLSYIIWISFATYLNYLSLNKIKLCNDL